MKIQTHITPDMEPIPMSRSPLPEPRPNILKSSKSRQSGFDYKQEKHKMLSTPILSP